MKGTICEWDKARGFGYIKPDDPDYSKVFVYHGQVEGAAIGTRLEFEIGPPNDDSRLGGREGSARNVTVIGKSEVDHVELDERLSGVVVHMNDERGYGFINDGHTKGRRVWFGTNSMQGETFKIGDQIEFVLTKTIRDTGRAASRVWRK